MNVCLGKPEAELTCQFFFDQYKTSDVCGVTSQPCSASHTVPKYTRLCIPAWAEDLPLSVESNPGEGAWALKISFWRDSGDKELVTISA